MPDWFARPVLFVTDIDRAVDFYVKQLGFTQAWRYDEDGKGQVAQVERTGCELIFSVQWPKKVGTGMIFLSLELPLLEAFRKELEARAVPHREGSWGYRCLVVDDPDGNALWFAYPNDA